MNLILVYLICLYGFAFIYDRTLDDVIRSNPQLTTKLTEFKYFNSLQSRPKALYSALSFQFWGITPKLNLIGCLFSVMLHAGLLTGAYLLVNHNLG
ncbi:hypothetical protein [Algibacillus agarilyticus]|uniref:hypothetical protein n=1 Tax=Algibacillus agarilyticus TaxID=2234133 RepID=UPI000DCFF192|nr:hypothetical protein [Algibacillus agarilyticus]